MKFTVILTEEEMKSLLKGGETTRSYPKEKVNKLPGYLGNIFEDLEINIELSEFNLTSLCQNIVEAEIHKYIKENKQG